MAAISLDIRLDAVNCISFFLFFVRPISRRVRIEAHTVRQLAPDRKTTAERTERMRDGRNARQPRKTSMANIIFDNYGDNDNGQIAQEECIILIFSRTTQYWNVMLLHLYVVLYLLV